ncbi:aminotransferase class V-fold PLP-dependent enzyme [Virgibacillus sp. W0430]|uniref:aminotransferase class V-fold PLP-dependent enzyme n=1 Tax=Virgibacillus sp. W0430 TaxID=3391580 RepID=UPI003F44C111
MESYSNKFIGLEHTNYFYTGAESPALKENIEILKKYLLDKSEGELGRAKANKVENQLKTNIAAMIQAKENEISFSGNASESINNIVEAMDIEPGSNIIINDLEYPSVVLPLLSLQKRKRIEVILLKSVEGQIRVDEIESKINDKTCLVAISHVSYVNGYKHDLKQLKKITDNKNVPLLVDATQSLGVVEVNSNYFDMMVSSSYKWLLGTHGIGVTYVSEDYLPKLNPKRVGWRSVQSIFHDKRFEDFDFNTDATKFELGFNNYPGIYALENSTRLLLEVGIKNIEKKVIELGGELIKQLKEQGWKLLTPESREKRAGNIAVACKNGEEVMNELERKNIKIWGGDGRLRFSVNFYNNEKEIETLLKELNNIKKGEKIS